MVMKSRNILAFRLFKKQFVRFFTIVAIVLVSVSFMAGIGEVENKVKTSANNFYLSQNISDFYIKSKAKTGFSIDELEYFESQFGSTNIVKSFSTELKVDNNIVRYCAYDFSNLSINKLNLLEGNWPNNNNEVVVERKTIDFKSYNIGDTIEFMGNTYTVTGIVLNPLIINKAKEPSLIFESEFVSNVIYFNLNNAPIINDIYINLENRELFNGYSSSYEKTIFDIKNKIEHELEVDRITVLTLFENYGYNSLVYYAEKVGDLSIIFVVFFILVTLLVVYSTMTRLLDEERSQIACMKTLGYGNMQTILRYVLFVLFATLLGGGLAFGVGYALTRLLYFAFNIVYFLPKFPSNFNFIYYTIVFAILLVIIVGSTLLSCINVARNRPVVLLAKKTPKAGKRIFLEYMPFIWNRFSFKYKSTIRNVFLFKSRFFMTVLSVVGSTVLVLAGLGLFDNANKIENSAAIVAISIVLIVFSAVLSELVIYNLTNINISERNREIATLMVLGYHDKEVSGYIYREIYILTIIGALIGMPVGYGFLIFLFDFVDFGAINDVNWWSWIIAPVLIMLFSFLSTFILYRKIIKTDMNASLKSLD